MTTMTSMNTTTTIPRDRDPGRDRLLALAKGSRFEGHVYLDFAARPLAATDGQVLVVRGVRSCDDARQALVGAHPQGDLPPVRTVDGLLRLASEGVARLVVVVEGRTVALDTVPDDGLVSKAEAEAGDRLAAARDKVEKAERALERALETRRGSIGEARAKLASARADVRAEDKRRDPGYRGVRVGEAAFDLALIAKALRALGARSGTLQATGGSYDAGVLYPETGIALIMPFRQ
jgi:hypothetical protein